MQFTVTVKGNAIQLHVKEMQLDFNFSDNKYTSVSVKINAVKFQLMKCNSIWVE